MNTKGFSYSTREGLFGAYTENNNKEGSTPLYVTFTEKPNEFGLLIKKKERKDMSENEISRNADLLWAWQYGVEFKNTEDDLDKACIILEFEGQVLEDTELQDAFAVGANGLPFSEVKKGQDVF